MLTEAAGMTHGSLYSQFGSKERLVEEALEHAIATSGRTTAGTATLHPRGRAASRPPHAASRLRLCAGQQGA